MFNKKEYDRQYRISHKEECKERDRKKYLKNKEVILKRAKDNYLLNKEEKKQKSKLYYHSHKLERKEYYDFNKEQILQQHQEWKELHPEYQKIYRDEQPWTVTHGNIIQRCTNPNNRRYKWYKDKFGDITVEQLRELWFECKAYLMEQPEIDRIDNDGVYTKCNLHYIEKVDHIIKTAQERKMKKLGVKR